MNKKIIIFFSLFISASLFAFYSKHINIKRKYKLYGGSHNDNDNNSDDINSNISKRRFGLCDPFSSTIEIKKLEIPKLNITAFFLGCTFTDNKVVITTFLEKIPPDLPLHKGYYHAQHAENFKDVKLNINLKGTKDSINMVCDTPVSKTEAVVLFYCEPNKKNQDDILFKQMQLEDELTLYIKTSSTKYTESTSLRLCNKPERIVGSSMCITYMPVAGKNWMELYREHIEYHRLIGVNKIFLFEHTDKHKEEFDKYYKDSAFVSRIQWPPLTTRPDKFYAKIDSVSRECYDQSLVHTYCVINSDYKWAFSMDTDEYIWNKDLHKPLVDVLESEGKDSSSIFIPTVVMLRNETERKGLVIEDNNYVCKIYNCGKTAYKASETYALKIHMGKTKGKAYNSKMLKVLHFRNMYLRRNPINASICDKTDKYYKPYASKIRKALSATAHPSD